MPTMKLNDARVRKLAAPVTGQTVAWDEALPRFGLRLAAGGARTWVVKYRAGGRARWMTLGTYPLVSLASAKKKAKEALAEVVQGVDPATERHAAREAATFEDLASEYLERHAKPRKRSWKEDERILRVYVPKSWDSAPAHTITRRDVRDLLDKLAEKTPIMANRVLACLRKVFNFGIDREVVEVNPCARVTRPAAERQRDRVLTADDLRRLWAALADAGGTGSILKLMLYTAQRGGEVKAMRWDDVDLEGGWWTVPATVAKNRLAHRVPLSAPAVALLHTLANDSTYVFSSTSETGHRATVVKAVADLRTASGVDFVPHDLRRTVATFLTSELGVSRLVVSKLLNHVETGITKVYDRASYDREKRQALDAWARRLDAIVMGKAAPKVVELRRS